MALKKNFFKGLQGGISNSPIKMHHNSPGPTSFGVNIASQLANNLFGDNRTKEELAQLSKNQERKMTNEEVYAADSNTISGANAANMDAPQTEEEYKRNTFVRPFDNTNEGGGLMGYGLNLAYNNPKLLDLALSVPFLNNRITEEAKRQMALSGGASSTDLSTQTKAYKNKQYEEYIKETNSFNESLKNMSEEEKRNYVNDYGEETTSEDLKIQEIKDRKSWDIQQQKENLNYTGSYNSSDSWRRQGEKDKNGNLITEPPNPVDQFWSKKGLYDKAKYTPKSDYYDFQKSYSVKGDVFDQQLDSYGISKDQGWDYLNNTDKTQDENNNDNITLEGKLNNRQMIPYVLEENMRINPYMQQFGDFNLNQTYPSKEETNEAFNNLYSGKGGYFDDDPESPTYQTYVNQDGPMYGSGEETPNISRLMDTDYGRAKIGFGMDSKLPYMSISDSNDYQAVGKGGYGTGWGGDDYGGTVSDQFKQSQVLNQTAQKNNVGGFKLNDRFYFTPDNYRDYIPDKDVKFMKEFYGSNNYDNLSNGVEIGNNPDWIQPETNDEVIINAKRGNKKKLTEAELNAKYGKINPITNRQSKPKINISKRNVILD
jgi:hypothetical protein